jgi:hypothetical protein
MTNIPSNWEDPFFSAIVWFNSTVNLLYPQRQVVGYYVTDTGQFPQVPLHGHDADWRFTAEGIELNTLIFPEEKKLRYVNYNQVIALRYDKKSGNIELLKQFPKELLPGNIQATGYAPEKRIKQTFPTAQMIRMFGR